MEPYRKFYSKKAITIATYFGGPLAAGYLIKKNYQSLNQPDKGSLSIKLGIISTLILFSGIFMIPEELIDQIPNALIPAVYTIIIYFIVSKTQGQYLKEHKETGGDFYSGWNAAGVGFISLLIIVAFIFLSSFVIETLTTKQPEFDAVAYDKGVAEFIENETIALAVFNRIETDEPEQLINELNDGIIIWNNNKLIVNKLNQIENLPERLLIQNDKLFRYCELRIEYNKLYIKALTEEIEIYKHKIDKLSRKINELIDSL